MGRKILLHTCCGPCSIVPVKALKEEGVELSGYFMNPNVQPLTEWRKRLEALTEHLSREGVPLLPAVEYDVKGWLREIVGKEEERCATCYRLRLEATAREAVAGGFDGFTSSLLYSRFQNHALIREIAEAAAREAGVSFHYRDWRPGWSEGVAESKALGMYRQQYCGCIYSEEERYRNAKTKGQKP